MKTTTLRIALLTTLSLVLCFNSFSQWDPRKEIGIPDIPGYKTLKCDLHIHTIFSDGKVWPTIRVDEAWAEGLDVIAITDHVEYAPHKNDIVMNRNRSNEIAAKTAKSYGLIYVPGAEITRNYPFGHYNTLFIKDVEKIHLDDQFESIEAAKKQGAFIVWNHPGWRQENQIPIWYDEQQRLYDSKIMSGIEIVNGSDYYPLAHKWAIEKNLTILGNTDVHGVVGMQYDIVNSHRPMTLVFAKERSADGVREALDNRRTAVYHKDTLIGSVEFLKPIFEAGVTITKTDLKMKDGAMWQSFELKNTMDIPIHMKRISEDVENIGLSSGMYIPPHKTIHVTVKALEGIKEGKQEITVTYLVENFYIGPREGMPVDVKLSVEYTKE